MAVHDPQSLLKRLIKEPAESAWLEFKENNCDPEMIGSWISACANAAILAGKERAFMVFGVRDSDREMVGTSVRFATMKKGGENFENWLTRMIEPRLMMQLINLGQTDRVLASYRSNLLTIDLFDLVERNTSE